MTEVCEVCDRSLCCLNELFAPLPVTEVYEVCDRSLRCLNELAATLAVTEVTLPRRPHAQHALPIVPQNNEITYAAEFSREICKASYPSSHSRSLENR